MSARPTRFTKRVMIVCAAVVAIVLGFSTTAQAENATLILSDVDGRQLGVMTHVDREPDTFHVCDSQNDLRSVTGTVSRNGVTLASISDGPDAGCNVEVLDLENALQYRLTLCRTATSYCTSTVIRE